MTVLPPTHRNTLPSPSRVILEDQGQGILSIRLVRDDSAAAVGSDAITLLQDALKAAAARDSLKVVLLAGLDDVFSGGDRALGNAVIDRGLTEALAGFAYPLIAEMSGDGVGPALLLAGLCDVMVCSESAHYGWSADNAGSNFPSPAEYDLAEARFGAVLAAELLTGAQVQTGLALRDKGWCCPVVPEGEVAAHARALAAQLANKSQDSLRLLKQHLARPLHDRSRALVCCNLESMAATPATLPKTLGKHVALRDQDGQILVLTLRRGGKKHDTRAMAQELQATFERSEIRSGYRAIVIASEYPGFLPEADASVADDELHELMQALLTAPLPVVAMAGAALEGKAWLAVQCCDAVVYQDDGRYDASTLLSSSASAGRAALLFALRLGGEAAREILMTGASWSGVQLLARSPVQVSVPRAKATDAALLRAHGWTRWPHAAVLLWKSARAKTLNDAFAAQAHGIDVLPDAAAPSTQDAQANSPLDIALDSTVVSATLHPGGIVEVVMHDRASKNMMSPALVEGMAEAFAYIAATPACKAVVLTGYDTYFCSGGTKDALRAIQEGSVIFTDDRTFRLPLDCTVPVIAAMQGHGIGAGLSLGLYCDFPLLSEESHYVSPYMGYGFTPGVGATLIVPERFGQDLARETLLTACEYEGCAVQARGVPLAVLERKQVRDAAMSLARRLARQPKSGLALMKSYLNQSLRDRLDTICEQEVAMHAATFVGRADTLAQIEAVFGRGEEGKARPVTAPAAVATSEVSLYSVRHTLMHMLAKELHLEDDEIDVEMQYTDLGLDSITGVTWIRKVNEHYGLSLDATIVYTYPTVSKLAQHVKTLIESRDAEQATPDLAELQTAKLRAFGQGDTAAHTASKAPVIVLAEVDTTTSPAVAASGKVSLSSLSEPVLSPSPVSTPTISQQVVSQQTVSLSSIAPPSGAQPTISPTTHAQVAISLSSIRSTLTHLLARELHLEDDETDPEMQYTDLGLDSITGVTWIRKVNEHYGLSLDATIVYTYPTVSKLAQHVKTLVESRDAEQATPDLAELQTRKLRAFGSGETAGHVAGKAPVIVLAEMDTAASSASTANSQESQTPVPVSSASLSSIQETLARLLARELHLEISEVDPETQYTDLGLDSITGVTWMRKVNEHYGLSLDATIVYTYPTLSKLAQHVKTLVDTRDLEHATPDLAELQTRKLRSFRDEDVAVQGNRIVLAETGGMPVVAVPTPTPEPARTMLVSLSQTTDMAVRETSAAADAPFRQLMSWRQGPTAQSGTEMIRTAAPSVPEDIAVIGMAGQFPMARDLETFWQNLQSGLNCIQEVLPERWDVYAHYQPGQPAEGKTNSKWLGQLEDYDRFDPLFFNISPAEARAMDPQQRMFLEACWHSIEHAGYDPKTLAGSRCGVFVGAAGNDYSQLSRKIAQSAYGFTGNACSILAGRIAYFLDLQGPCITLDTACSASLVAIATACDSLSAGNSDIALAGGVYVGAGPSLHIMTAQSGMLSQDGRCHTFDHRANGFVPGEAVGVVMLKRLSDAERDGDIIHAVVRGWGVNQDGRTNGITAPNPASQTRLMQDVYRRHRIDPAEIQLIEAHGTGTPLGDPIEIRGLIDAFGKTTSTTPYCALGSVKDSIGHCLTAAGVSAFIKAVLALEHRQLPPMSHFERLNEHIRLEGSPFYVNTSLQDWVPRDGARRHVAVSAFGYSGTNAHIVLGEYTGQPRKSAVQLPPAFIVPLSAKAPAQLMEVARALLMFIQRDGDVALSELAYTLQVGRTPMEERLGFVVVSMAQLAERLQAYLAGQRDLPDFSAGQVQKNRESLSLIDQDEEFKDALLERWMEQKKYPQLLKLWAKGMTLDWNRLYGTEKPRRITLPTYPFARERYWIDEPDAVQGTVSVATSLAATPATAAPVREEAPVRLLFEERWVIDDGGAHAARHIEDHPRDVILIASADTGWTLPGASRIDAVSGLVAAVDRAYALSGRPVSVVCATARGRQRDGIHVLFDLFKQVKACADRVSDVLLVGLYDPTYRDGIWDTSWIGFERSLRVVMPDLKVSLLYTDDRTNTGPHVLEALQTGGIVAYREDKRYVLSLDSVTSTARTQPPRFKQHGHYLITGGCGALGGLFARFLAETCQAHLVLMGRRPHSDDIEQQLVALRSAGARSVEYVSLDITDASAVAAWARTLPGTLTGVIHAAGISQARPFHEKTEADIDAILGPKTTGSLILDDALRDQPLDLVCYFSSSSAILGDAGACDYAIANRFLMDYGRYRTHAGLPGKTVVINWPLWEKTATGQAGMGPESAAQTAFYLKSSGQSALSGRDGLSIWQGLLAEDRTQTLVMYGQPARITSFLGRLYGVPETMPAPVPAIPAVVSSSSGDWRARLRDDVRHVVAQTMELPLERLNDETNLVDYGFDSISLTTLAKNLESQLSIEVTPALFFNRSNVQGLIEHFASEHALHFEQQYSPGPVSSSPTTVASTMDTGAAAHVVAPAVTPSARVSEMPVTQRLPVAHGQSEGVSPVAIVGMSGRFPKATDVGELWDLLAAGRDGIDDVPPSRWNWRDYFTAEGHRDNIINAKRGGFVEGMDTFDPLFFEVSPVEAEEMDPSERLLLMEAYRAIEDAGIAPASLRGRSVGVFVGMEESQYSLVTDSPGVTTLGAAMISSRLSYFLDLRGQALATNTACSSGLVALHQAVGSIQQGECEAALVASVALSLSPKPWVKMSEAGMISPDGLCRSFSKHADGISIGEAAVAVVLMPLQSALEQGLPVYGVIRGSGINFDGKTNGVTAPNGAAQEQLIETVYTRHGIDVRDVSHVVAHGTGTRLGDPVELNALHNAFKTLTKRHSQEDGVSPLPCAVTSVKSNLGHTMAASGLVSLVALLQGIAHRQIPATLNCEEDNDYITWRDSRLYINKTTRAWETPNDRLRVGAVSAFGRSGTNAHVVVGEFRDDRALAPSPSAGKFIVPLSARTTEQLRQRVEDLLAFLKRTDEVDLAAVAQTLQQGRDALTQRLAVVTSSTSQLRRELEDWLAGKPSEQVSTGKAGWRHAVGPAETQTNPSPSTGDDALSTAAKAWVQGNPVDWTALRDPADASHPRLHLPTYPFAQDRYWIDEKPPQVASVKKSPGVRPKSISIEDILDQVDAGTLAGGAAAAALKTLAGETR